MILELLQDIAHNGVRWGILITAFVLYRKELRNRRLDERDIRFESMLQAIMKELGITWDAGSITLNRSLESKLLTQLQRGTLPVLSIIAFIPRWVTKKFKLRRKKKMNLLKNNVSKKLTVAIVTILLAALNEKLGLQMSEDTILVMAGVAATYIAGQSAVDSKKAKLPPEDPDSASQTN